MEDILLERECYECGGDGLDRYHDGYEDDDKCPLCDGYGKIPTATGERILLLIAHNFKGLSDHYSASTH